MSAVSCVAELPLPSPGRLVLYVLGPGFGESQVIAFPDGRWMVVDSCVRAGINLPLALLRKLECPRIDLLVVTHPDLDHVRGIPGLLEGLPTTRLWRYPSARSLRDLMARWCRWAPKDRRLLDLYRAHCAIRDLATQRGLLREVGSSTRTWPPAPSGYEVSCIAPTDNDQDRVDEWLEGLLAVRDGEVNVAAPIKAQLLDGAVVRDASNVLSLALSVSWQDRHLLLGGDVQSGGSPLTGWRGVLEYLRMDGLEGLVAGCDLVKVAHHGSEGSFHAAAWALHAKPDRSTVALLTPFNRSRPPLPHESVLAGLRSHAGYLGITSDTCGAFRRAAEVGWRTEEGAARAASGAGALVAAAFEADGSVLLHAGSKAGLFRAVERKSRHAAVVAAGLL